MTLQAIFFDFDGVLVESLDVKTEAFATLYAKHGAAVEEAVKAYHLANGGVPRSEKFRYYDEFLLNIPHTAARAEELAGRFSELVVEKVVAAEWVSGAKEALDVLYRRLPLYVASGTPQSELRAIIYRRGMDHYFRGVYGAPSTKGEVIRTVCAESGHDPTKVLMIGDALSDLEGARDAGVAFLGRRSVANTGFPRDVTVIEDLSDLPNRLGLQIGAQLTPAESAQRPHGCRSARAS